MKQQVNLFGGTVRVDSNGTNQFKVELVQGGYWSATDNNYNSSYPLGIDVHNFNGNITAHFGAVQGGFTAIAPAGVQAYAGIKQYMTAATPDPTNTSANFFEVAGKSAFLSGLTVSGSFSVSGVKNFQITHPLDENKWLYHTSIESPRADLIYRGIIELENGSGSASIDKDSNMTPGTFEALTINPQLFLQNNQTFDRVKGYIENGNVFIVSENINSTALIDWSVIAERNDVDILNSTAYSGVSGNYNTEKYKGEFYRKNSPEYLEVSSSI